MMPQKKKQTSLTAADAVINGLPEGWVLFRDVGWRIPTFLHRESIPFITFEHVKPTTAYAKALAAVDWDYHEEYQINHTPMVVHHRGASLHAYRKSPRSNAFYDAAWNYINDVEKTRHTWSKIASGKPEVISTRGVKPKKIEVRTPNPPKKPKRTTNYVKASTNHNFIIASALPLGANDYIAEILRHCGVSCGIDEHFNMSQCGFNESETGDSSWAVTHYLKKVPKDIPIFQLVRDPNFLIPSFIALDTIRESKTGSYVFNTQESKEWIKKYAKGFDFSEKHEERACKAWVNWNLLIEKSKRVVSRINVEDICYEDIALIGEYANIDISRQAYDVAVRKAKFNSTRRSNQKPLSSTNVSEKTWNSLIELANEYGYKI
jgi:hypothetical protein